MKEVLHAANILVPLYYEFSTTLLDTEVSLFARRY